jgi:hypothetical protein
MPAIRAGSASPDRVCAFHQIEGRFAWQARIWVTLAGLSGFWMVHRADMWGRFARPGFRLQPNGTDALGPSVAQYNHSRAFSHLKESYGIPFWSEQ